MIKKAIILAGGFGTRLFPGTKAISKQLIPIYDKPMIYYSLSIILLSGIREILIISDKNSLDSYKRLFENFYLLGLKIIFKIQENPNGIPEAFIIGEDFIGNDNIMLVLGDNLLYSQNLTLLLKKCIKLNKGSTILSYKVSKPEDYGIIEFNSKGAVKRILEKPKNSNSNQAIIGVYFFDNKVIKYSKKIKKSPRGETEITDLLGIYLKNKELNFVKLPRGLTWLDTGSNDNLLKASNFIQAIEHQQGFKVACLEEIIFNNKWASKNQFNKYIRLLPNTSYKNYIENFLKTI